MPLETKLEGLKNRAKAIIAKAEEEGSELYREIGQLFHDILGGDEPPKSETPTGDTQDPGPS